MNAKLVSIIVPVYNSEKFIKNCIDSILAQTYKPIEIIIVFDPSDDTTLDILISYGTKINLVLNPIKTSPSRARNIGLKMAKGDYISFCDSDDLFSPDKIKKQVDILEEKSYVGLIYSDFFLIDADANTIGQIKTPDWNQKKWISQRYIALSSIVFRKRFLKSIGYFNESYFSSEDFDFLLRLSKITEFQRLPEYLTYHRIHENNLSKKSLIGSFVNQLRIYFKHGVYLIGIYYVLRGLLVSPFYYLLLKNPSMYQFIRKYILRRDV